MAKLTIGLGTPPSGTDGDTVRTAFDKTNKNFTELYEGAQADNIARVGSVVFFARSTAPAGYLKANGAAVSRTTFAALFAAIGTTFGAGDGATTFNLPDLRGEFPRGWDDGRGVDPGRAFGSSQLDAFQGHYHQSEQSTGGTTAINKTDVGVFNIGGPAWASLVGARGGAVIPNGLHGTPRAAAETRPRNVALLACIKH